MERGRFTQMEAFHTDESVSPDWSGVRDVRLICE